MQKNMRGGGAHGPPRNLQRSILRVLDTEETQGLPRLVNRPQASTVVDSTKKVLIPWRFWARHLAGLALLHTKNVYTIYRENRKQKQKQPHAQCQQKKDAVQIMKIRGGPRGGGRAHLPPLLGERHSLANGEGGDGSRNRNRNAITNILCESTCFCLLSTF